MLVVLLLGACSKPQQQPIEIEGQGAPALWKVTASDGKGGTGWLFGTVHSLPPDVHWEGPELGAAIRASDGLLIEVNGLQHKDDVARIFAHMGITGSQPPLRNRVPESHRKAIDELISRSNVPSEMLDQMKTWAAMLTLATSSRNDWGLAPGSGVEERLQLRFGADDKSIQGMETIEQQFTMFDRLPESDQRAMLVQMLDSNATARVDYEKMLADWMAGRSDQVLDKANDGLLSSPRVREALLDSRNRAWVEEIARRLARGEQPFVAVGAGHMAGPGGVPALLQAKGYKVERVQ